MLPFLMVNKDFQMTLQVPLDVVESVLCLVKNCCAKMLSIICYTRDTSSTSTNVF